MSDVGCKMTGTGVWEHFTPCTDDLQPYKEYKCTIADCNSGFYNRSHYEMHMMKKHNITVPKYPKAFKYHCPLEDCIYNKNDYQNNKYFKSLKYLKQHYQKVHMAKLHICDVCTKSFITATKLTLHRKSFCGKTYSCQDCHCKYDSYESLFMHMKRKQHNTANNNNNNNNNNEEFNKCAIKRISTGKLRVKKKQRAIREMKDDNKSNIDNQDIDSTKIVDNDIKLSTTDIEELPDQLANLQSLLRTIQTQTDAICMEDYTLGSENNYVDRMLTQFSNMYTQTCDKLLSQLAPIDMQTQTNWASLNEMSNDANITMNKSNNNNNNAVIRDELLVSTETQTSFIDCLRNSTYPMDSSNSQLNNGNTENSMSLYHTQYTQTCESDIFLQGLGFSTNSVDLMDGFQSTYTQT